MNNNINLLQDRKTRIGIIQYNKLRLLRIVAVGLLFFVSAFSIILFMLIAFSPLPELKKQEEKALFSLSQFHGDMTKISFINERTDTITDVLSKRKSFDKTLETVQANLPGGISVDALSMNKNTVSLSVSSKSLELLDNFINNFLRSVQNKKDFSQVTLTNLSIDTQKNQFLLTIALVTL